MRNICLKLLFMLAILPPMHAQETDYPLIGAQVFIEPGQSRSDIEGYFKTLHSSGMEVARIRIFGSHLIGNDKDANYELYDHAFECADKYGVKLFATLFPPTDELNDIGGFKFPYSKSHLKDISNYISCVVSHFAKKPALYVWVLQNEPGSGSLNVARNDLSDSLRTEFYKTYGKYQRAPGYLNADFSEAHFHRYYTGWYLSWLEQQIRKHDTVHYTHINPHALFSTLPEYDFAKYEEFLTSLGVSIHASWHLGFFTRNRYSLGFSVMSDIIRSAAGKNKFWITEIQGGGVIASGDVPLTPSASEIRQWLWTGIGAGAEGSIFWTLNPRAAVGESGEWAMIDYLGRPTERLLAASEVIKAVKSEKEFFKGAEVVKGGIAILYNVESLMAASTQFKGGDYEGRKSSSVIKSVVAAYNSISSMGVIPEIVDMEKFSWDCSKDPVVIIPDMVSLHSKYNVMIEEYVKRGGRIIVTGRTGFYDENLLCLYQNGFPLKQCFGGTVSEFVVDDNLFDVGKSKDSQLTGHLWKGIISEAEGEPLFLDKKGVTGQIYQFGEGSVIWVPSLVNLGDWISENGRLALFYRQYCMIPNITYPVYFQRNYKDVFMRLLRNDNEIMAIVVNNNNEPVKVRFNRKLDNVCTVDGSEKVTSKSVSIQANDVVVFKFEIR